MTIEGIILLVIAVLFLILIGIIFYITIILKIVSIGIERLVGTSHYQQAESYSNSVKAPKAERVKEPIKANHPIVDNELINFNDVPDEIAMQAIENWGIEGKA
jgi:hypothetical protein